MDERFLELKMTQKPDKNVYYGRNTDPLKRNVTQFDNTRIKRAKCVQLDQSLKVSQKSKPDLKITMIDGKDEIAGSNAYQEMSGVPIYLTMLDGKGIKDDGYIPVITRKLQQTQKSKIYMTI